MTANTANTAKINTATMVPTMHRFINLTPHALSIEGLGTIPASGQVARVETSTVPLMTVGGVRVCHPTRGPVTGIPEPKEGVSYIVSGMVLEAVGGTRGDVYAPDTGADAIRDERKQIIAVRGLLK